MRKGKMKNSIVTIAMAMMLSVTAVVGFGTNAKAAAGNTGNKQYSYSNIDPIGSCEWRTKNNATKVYVYPTAGPKIYYEANGRKKNSITGQYEKFAVIMLGISIYYYANGSILGMMDVGIWAMYYFDYGLFLAFALMYSDARVLFMFFIPIRAFWVAVIDMGLMAYEFMRPTTSTLNRGSIIAYLVNFFIFYLIMGRGVGMRSSNSKAAAKRRKRDYDRRVENLSRQVNGEADRRHKAQQMGYPSNITKHKCAICGRTERDGDDLEFRFCSKCNGNYEYCNEHLFTHEHVK